MIYFKLKMLIPYVATTSLIRRLCIMYYVKFLWLNCSYFWTENWFISSIHIATVIVSSRVSVPPWNIDLTPFYLAPSPPKKNSESANPPPFMSNSPQNFGELKSLPLKWILVQKKERLIFKETKDYFQH